MAHWGRSKSPMLRQHPTKPRWPKHERSKWTPNNWRSGPNTGVWPVIYHTPHRTIDFGTRPFFRWVHRRADAHTRPALPKIPSAPLGILLIRGASGAWQKNPTPHKRVKAWVDGPLIPEEISCVKATPNRAALTKTRSTEVLLKQLVRQTKHGVWPTPLTLRWRVFMEEGESIM